GPLPSDGRGRRAPGLVPVGRRARSPEWPLSPESVGAGGEYAGEEMLNRRYYIALGIVVVVTLVLLKLPGKAANQLKLAIGGLFLPASGLTVSGRELTKK